MSAEVRADCVHAFGDDALGDSDLVDLVRRVHERQVSATELVDAAIARCAAVNDRLDAIETPDFDRARERAAALASGGALPGLAGVPMFFKDNVKVAGLPMHEGSLALSDRPMTSNGKVVQQIIDTGVIPLGTTRMPEFGWVPTTERADGVQGHNPWNLDYSSGGSSGGSAALVAAGAVPMAHGNDGGGSIRIPAANCGLVGLKPTRARLRLGEVAAAPPVKIVSDSVLVRSVRDVALFYAEAEKVWRNHTLPPVGHITRPVQRRLKIGLAIDSPMAPPSDAPTRQAVEQLAGLLADLGHQVDEVVPPVPATFKDDFIDYWSFLAMTIRDGGRLVMGRGFDRSKLDPMTVGLGARGRRVMHKAPIFIARLARSGHYVEQRMGDLDLFLTPVLTRTTPKLGYFDPQLPFAEGFSRVIDYAGFTPLHNATGAPAVSLPTGTAPDGMPIGVMLSARRGADALLIETALQIEEAAPFRRITG